MLEYIEICPLNLVVQLPHTEIRKYLDILCVSCESHAHGMLERNLSNNLYQSQLRTQTLTYMDALISY